MDNSLKGLILAAGVIITCIVIGLGFYIAREARDTASNGAGQISKLNAEFNESDKVMYDGLNVSGTEVINVVNKYKNDDLGVIVTTKKGTTNYIHEIIDKTVGDNSKYSLGKKSTESIKTAQQQTAITYINPNVQFMGEVLRDENNTIVGLRFTQE